MKGRKDTMMDRPSLTLIKVKYYRVNGQQFQKVQHVRSDYDRFGTQVIVDLSHENDAHP